MTAIFGGLEFSSTSRMPPYDSNCFLPISYVSFLVSQSYGASEEVRQSIFDALSPFQLLSKAWSTYTVRQLINHYHVGSVYYPGSWFGQSCVSLRGQFLLESSQHILVDKDPVCSDIAHKGMRFHCYGTQVLCEDFLSLSIPKEKDPPLVVWTGLEHFDLAKVREFLKQFQAGTLFLFQGTDMPAPDHISPIYSPGELLRSLGLGTHNCVVKDKGSIFSAVGNRHQVVVTI